MSAADQVERTQFPKQEWLYPDTTKDFERLPFEYRVSSLFHTALKDFDPDSVLPGILLLLYCSV